MLMLKTEENSDLSDELTHLDKITSKELVMLTPSREPGLFVKD